MTSADSYLRVDKVLAAAKATEYRCHPPGYGFLSETPALPDRAGRRSELDRPSPASIDALTRRGPAAKTLGGRQACPAAGLRRRCQSDARFVPRPTGSAIP